ncbi:dihydroneopterin aldolase [Thermomicrobium sp. 4228-Ro]|uniref:dihydroneopterin aldolase n=1 Tax=Thermomicrobium sp. 4228-Ro TaxID=2993937 RepID=UPI0022490173|nr:dihydroneopterin aldolase [Thermomicrobium sp. 4228-Ro]MCX2726556.1 dihydroneopterin aldolase [Thermomicrobium sp. 4228-Ro]
MADRILLEGLQFYGYHGVHPEERQLGQRFAVDLEVELDLEPAAVRDALAETVNYGALYQTVRRVLEGEPRQLLEAVAGEIVRAVFAEYPPVAAVRVRVWKLSPPIAGAAIGRVGVELRRTRQEIESAERSGAG